MSERKISWIGAPKIGKRKQLCNKRIVMVSNAPICISG